MAQEIVRSSYTIFDQAPSSSAATDLSQYIVAAWCLHPELIPSEVGCIVLELEEPSEVGRSPFFLRAYEIIHSKRDTLQFRVFIKIIEIHDFSPWEVSSDVDSSGSSDSNGDGLLRSGSSSLCPWPRVFRVVGWSSAFGSLWPSLPRHGGDVSWDPPTTN
jgi:hypothetical protein